jgi:predicted hydrocarbon binding protein
VEIADIAQRSVRGDVPPGVLLDRMRKDVELRGFGRITVASFDPRTGEAIIRIKNSPYADPSAGNGHGCRFPAGFWAGVVSALARRPVVSEEMQCLRGGGELCEFRVFPTS